MQIHLHKLKQIIILYNCSHLFLECTHTHSHALPIYLSFNRCYLKSKMICKNLDKNNDFRIIFNASFWSRISFVHQERKTKTKFVEFYNITKIPSLFTSNIRFFIECNWIDSIHLNVQAFNWKTCYTTISILICKFDLLTSAYIHISRQS